MVQDSLEHRDPRGCFRSRGLSRRLRAGTWSWLVALAPALALVACPNGNDELPPPTADAGEDFTVPWGQMVVLNGECTHPDPVARSKLTQRWDMVDWPSASSLSPEDIEGRDARDAFFEPDASGPYVFTFRCAVGPFDSAELMSAESMVTATVEEPPANRPPVIDVGEDIVAEVGSEVVLFVEASDPDGDPLTFEWSLFQEPDDSELTDDDIIGADLQEAAFVPDVPGLYRFLVSVDDGREGGRVTGTLDVTAIEVVRLDGEITITVVDAETSKPVEDATVLLTGEHAQGLSGTTDGDGVVKLADEELAGPVDIHVEGPPETVELDHDGDPDTPPVTVPRYRTTVLTGIDRTEATVLLEPTAPAWATSGKGIVRGCIGEGLFDALPEVERMFSFLAGARMSGQLRMILVSPIIPRTGLVDLEVGDFLVPSPHAGVPFPGNMGTDDPFLNEYASQFGVEDGPCAIDGSAAPFSEFQLEAPAGGRHFGVLGGVATLDILRLLGLLLGAAGEGSIDLELSTVLGAIDFDPLFIGFLEVDVPDGGEIDVSSKLASSDGLSAVQWVDHSVARQTVEVCDDAGYCQELHQVRLFPATTLEVAAEPPPVDPRVALAMPDTSPFELFCLVDGAVEPCDPPNIVDVEVPETTGTDVPYGLDMVLLEMPEGHALAPAGGLAIAGFKFARAPGLESELNVFPVPALEGPLSGLGYSGVSLAFRRLLARASDGAYFFQIGRTADSMGRMVPGAHATVDPGRALPFLAVDPDGLEVEVLFAVEDPVEDPPNVVLSHALVKGLSEPGPERDLPDLLPLDLEDGVDLVVVTFSSVDRSVAGGQNLPARVPRATLLLPGDAAGIEVPDLSGLFSPGDEVHVAVAGYALRGSFAYQQPHDPRLAQRRRAVATDAWSFQMP